MDQDTFVLDDDKRDGGAELIDRFSKKWPVQTAFWVKPSDRDRWFLYIAAAGIDHSNIREGYEEVLRLVKTMRGPYFDPFQVNLVESEDPLVSDVMELHRRYAQVKLSPTNFNASYLGGMSIEGAYLYPLPNISSAN
jgi:hypothetical protein